MVRLVLLSTVAPSSLARELEEWGYEVYEAVSGSEVLHLVEHRQIDAVVISADATHLPHLPEIRSRRITLQLQTQTATVLVSELTTLFSRASSIQ